MTVKYEQAAAGAVNWLRERLLDDGSYLGAERDLAYYYKSPYLLQLTGHPRDACRVLDYVCANFARDDGDFTTSDGVKSRNGVYQEFWSYPDGWIAMAARRTGRLGVAQSTLRHLRSYEVATTGGFRPNRAGLGDAISTAHIGRAILQFGDVETARRAGRWLARLAAAQPDVDSGFLLRADESGELDRDVPVARAGLQVVNTSEPDQAYFMIGYPMAFLAKLFEVTGDPADLGAACAYFDFAMRCGDNVRTSRYSHKVGWGAAVLAKLTGDRACAGLALDIADHLVGIQHRSGSWVPEGPAYETFDNTAEIAIWLLEISTELRQVQVT